MAGPLGRERVNVTLFIINLTPFSSRFWKSFSSFAYSHCPRPSTNLYAFSICRLSGPSFDKHVVASSVITKHRKNQNIALFLAHVSARKREPKDPMGPLPALIPGSSTAPDPQSIAGPIRFLGYPFQHLIVDNWVTRLFVGHHRPEPHLSMAGLAQSLQKSLA